MLNPIKSQKKKTIKPIPFQSRSIPWWHPMFHVYWYHISFTPGMGHHPSHQPTPLTGPRRRCTARWVLISRRPWRCQRRCGKSPCWMGKSTNSMGNVIPEGNKCYTRGIEGNEFIEYLITLFSSFLYVYQRALLKMGIEHGFHHERMVTERWTILKNVARPTTNG